MHILTHWGRVTHICVGKSTIIGSDNGLSPDRRQAIIWTNAGILLIGPLGTYFSEILTGIQTFSFKKMYLKMSSAKWCPFCLGLNVLMRLWQTCDEEYSEKRTMSVVQSYYNLRKLPRATTNVQKNKSYVGLFISYVGLFISYVGLIKSYVGLYNSYVGDKIS